MQVDLWFELGGLESRSPQDQRVFAVVCIVVGAFSHGRKSELSIEGDRRLVRSPHLQGGILHASVMGCVQQTEQHTRSKSLPSILGMYRHQYNVGLI